MGGDEVVTKSGLMVGLGETMEEMIDALGQLREQGVQVLTVGQYLRPTEGHLPIVRYWHPDEFAELERRAYELGFEHVACRPARALVATTPTSTCRSCPPPRRPEPPRGDCLSGCPRWLPVVRRRGQAEASPLTVGGRV